MIKFLKSFYFHQRFFRAIFTISLIFLFSFWVRELYAIAWLLASSLLVFCLLDALILFYSKGISAKRIVPERLSNSDINTIYIELQNRNNFKVYLEIIDELPVEFQERNFLEKLKAQPGTKCEFNYGVRPVKRGEYTFGKLNIYTSSILKLVKKREVFNQEQKTVVYPSFIQMKKFAFLAIDSRHSPAGLKKIRRIGHTQEFEQIKEYVPGDDVRSINWKTTAKHNRLMVNQYQDEKAQPLYSIIDTGRVMKMPFQEMTLLDYAINSSLAFSNIALQKKDKVGLFSFSDKIGVSVPASSKKTHLNLLLENLYNIQTDFKDSDFGILYSWANRNIKQRSLLLVYTNFEHKNGLARKLPFLRSLAKKHLVVVIFFENTELDSVITKKAGSIPEIAHQAIAEDFASEKRMMAKKLQQYGIQTVLTKPANLTVNTINKYLEIKSRGLL